MDVIALASFLVLVVAWVALPMRPPATRAEQKKAA